MLSKSDFLHYLDCPMHFWAFLRGEADSQPSLMAQFLMHQGQLTEKVIVKHLKQTFVQAGGEPVTFETQPSFSDGEYLALADVVVTSQGRASIYEIKSSTRLQKKHLYDATFQLLVAEASIPVDHVYVIHLNPEYVYTGHLDVSQMLLIEDVTTQCRDLAAEVRTLREQALFALGQASPHHLSHCYRPKSCPCLELCHPELPPHSIYELAGVSHKQLDTLLELGVHQMNDIPADFPLSGLQRKQVQSLQTNQPVIDHPALAESLSTLHYPLYFLDYETCTSALPLYPGYHPQQPMVFQYSLHIVSADGQLSHAEYLATEYGEPAHTLVAHLRQHIGETGSVIVWNKNFEASRNKEMAELLPDQRTFLLDLNERMYDLADIVRYGEYVDYRFGGSWSIKNVLPIIVPELNYQDLAISKGDQAMITWWELVHGEYGWDNGQHMADRNQRKSYGAYDQREQVIEALLKYCERDSEAMVRVWEKLMNIAQRANNSPQN